MGRALARAVQFNCHAVQGVQRHKEPQPARSASPRSQSTMGKVLCSKTGQMCVFLCWEGRQAVHREPRHMKNKGAVDSTWLAPDVTIPADHLALFFTSCRRWTCLQAVCPAILLSVEVILCMTCCTQCHDLPGAAWDDQQFLANCLVQFALCFSCIRLSACLIVAGMMYTCDHTHLQAVHNKRACNGVERQLPCTL